MNKKIVILTIFILSLLFLSGCSEDNLNSEPETLNIEVEKIEIINFHATQRCVACNVLGDYSKETIYEFFQPELRDGIISFQSINVDLAENREIAKKYQARGSSLYLNVIYDNEDHIEEDVRVWRLLGNEKQFKTYLKNKIEGILNQ